MKTKKFSPPRIKLILVRVDKHGKPIKEAKK
jgi:hypothetical protein